jgi:hypothetical protein
MRPRLRLALRLLKVLAFLGFTAYVVDVATTATGPATDIAFDIAVYAALVVHIARRRLDRRAADRQ